VSKNSLLKYSCVNLKKSIRPILKGDLDGCDKVEKAKPEIKEMIKLFGLPDKCPIGKVKNLIFCGSFRA
jgi:hypothetical protein